MHKSLCLSLFFIFIGSIVSAQTKVLPAVGQWRSHFSYNDAKQIALAKNKLYVATSAGVYSYDIQSNELDIINKGELTLDAPVAAIRYDDATKTLTIAYQNGDIDLVKNGRLVNMPQLKNANIVGSKETYDITFHNHKAYFSCAFGILVVNIDKEEVTDTYYLGNNGAIQNVYQVAIDEQKIYAATDSGLYVANVDDGFLSNFTNWKRLPNPYSYPKCKTTGVACMGGKTVAAIADQGFEYVGNTYSQVATMTYAVEKLRVSEGKLLSSNYYLIRQLNPDFSLDTSYFDNYNYLAGINDAMMIDGNMWFTNGLNGLVQASNNGYIVHIPNGPMSKNCSRLNFDFNNNLILSQGSINFRYNPGYDRKGFAIYDGTNWRNVYAGNEPKMEKLTDIFATAITPNNTLYAASYMHGILKYDFEKGVENVFDTTNSTLQKCILDTATTRISGMAIDQNNDLWVCNEYTAKPFLRMDNAGNWKSYSAPVFSGGTAYTGNIYVDSYNQKWAVIRNGGVLVFKLESNGQLQYRLLKFNNGENNTNKANSMIDWVQTPDGAIYIASDKGIFTVQNPYDILSSSDDVEPLSIVQDGFIQRLLEAETCTAIALDGGKRIWVGTSSGVFLFTPDGQKQIDHFDITNSPLPANYIYDIATHPVTGEVFIATDAGLVSYKADATPTQETADNVKVYPNPVLPDYEGVIAIEGLPTDANVKITDIAGNLVYQAKVNGGTATWTGADFKGKRVATGTYFANCSNADGSLTSVKKILFVR